MVLGAAVALFSVLTLVVAQEPKSAPPPDNAVAPAAPAAPTPADTTVAPATSAAPATPTAPAVDSTTDTATTPAADSTASSGLRRLDKPDTPPAEPKAGLRRDRRQIRINGGNGNDRVAVGHNVELAENETAGDLVAVFGSATNAGEVSGSVVSVLGNTESTGPVGDSAVAVLGNTSVNNRVRDAVVAVLGDVDLGPNAEVGGDVVAVGGTIHRDPKAIVHGHIQNVAIGAGLGHVQWAQAWFTECLLKLRLLSFSPHLGWAWGLAFGFLVLYVLLALLFRPGIDKCVTTLETRPGYSILAAILTVILIPVTIVLLCITVLGIAVVPFLVVGLMCAGLFGKAAMLAWLGKQFTRFFGDGPLNHPAFAVLIGGVIVMLLYTVPVIGIIFYKLLGWLGLGLAVYTLMLGMKREKPPAPRPTVPVVPPMAPPIAPTAGGAPGVANFSAGGLEPAMAVAGAAPVVPVVAASAMALPRAGFWIRMAALAIDMLLVGILAGLCGEIIHWFTSAISAMTGGTLSFHAGPPGFLLMLALYGALMWKLKGTTIGGIVCNLKVVRLDGREVDWATAVVRALACFLSLVVAGLGFIWIAIDDEKQAWHDKIAGTAVVTVPRGMALV
jgi:uncharacterized RDD family membrane protein YckC